MVSLHLMRLCFVPIKVTSPGYTTWYQGSYSIAHSLAEHFTNVSTKDSPQAMDLPPLVSLWNLPVKPTFHFSASGNEIPLLPPDCPSVERMLSVGSERERS